MGVLPAWSLAVPMNMATWGVAPAISNFAAAHAGCSCAPGDATVNATYRAAISFAFVLMPLSGLLSYMHPLHDMRRLRCLAGVQAVAGVDGQD